MLHRLLPSTLCLPLAPIHTQQPAPFHHVHRHPVRRGRADSLHERLRTATDDLGALTDKAQASLD